MPPSTSFCSPFVSLVSLLASRMCSCPSTDCRAWRHRSACTPNPLCGKETTSGCLFPAPLVPLPCATMYDVLNTSTCIFVSMYTLDCGSELLLLLALLLLHQYEWSLLSRRFDARPRCHSAPVIKRSLHRNTTKKQQTVLVRALSSMPCRLVSFRLLLSLSSFLRFLSFRWRLECV